jgi:TPR repeat protein
LKSLKDKRNKQLQDSVAAQLALGFRFENGITVSENCETSVAYIEQPARLSIDYVSRTHGLDTLEKLKLNLIGPFVIPEGSM